MNIYITTHPFSEFSTIPLDLLKSSKHNFFLNPKKRKLNKNELIKFCKEAEIIIAGTETYTASMLKSMKKLKLICRVGIGFDNIDLSYCKKNKIRVTYTPNAPTLAVADLTIGLSFNLLRKINFADQNMRNMKWTRLYGDRIVNRKVGIIGYGRIGSEVARLYNKLGCKLIYINDIKYKELLPNYVKKTSKNFIYNKCDLITLHIPLNNKTKSLIQKNNLRKMNPKTVLINTSRGGIIDENDLYDALKKNIISSAALDVFSLEPYSGKLSKLKNIILTSHMGSMSYDCRNKMEIEATNDALRFADGKKPRQILV